MDSVDTQNAKAHLCSSRGNRRSLGRTDNLRQKLRCLYGSNSRLGRSSNCNISYYKQIRIVFSCRSKSKNTQPIRTSDTDNRSCYTSGSLGSNLQPVFLRQLRLQSTIGYGMSDLLEHNAQHNTWMNASRIYRTVSHSAGWLRLFYPATSLG